MPFTIGENVGPYRITERLGQGGMATVYRAYHANLDRDVAIKILHAAFKEDPTFLTRFQREAQIVAKLEHPNIVPIYDYSEHNGEPYLVMKYIEGETLKARLSSKPLNLADTQFIMTAVAQALTYAHERDILHRDIKPSNILIEKGVTPYLADFGLARMASAGESTMSQDMMLGTPQYISPEQAQGVKDLDAATDIYSLGVILYELVVGRVPFSADTPYAIVHDHIFAPLPLPSKVNPQVPLAVERVLLKALAKNRADRYPSAVTMVEAFRDAIKESGLQELSAATYRVPMTNLGLPESGASRASVATMPPVPSIPSPIPPAGGTPQTIMMPATNAIPLDASAAASLKARQHRRNSLWMLGGCGSLMMVCLIGTFITASALGDPTIQKGLAVVVQATSVRPTPTKATSTESTPATKATIDSSAVTQVVTNESTATATPTQQSSPTPSPVDTATSTPSATATAAAVSSDSVTTTANPTLTIAPTATLDAQIETTLATLANDTISEADAAKAARLRPKDLSAQLSWYYAAVRDKKPIIATDALSRSLHDATSQNQTALALTLARQAINQKSLIDAAVSYAFIAFSPTPTDKAVRDEAQHFLYSYAKMTNSIPVTFFMDATNNPGTAASPLVWADLALAYQTNNRPEDANTALIKAQSIDATLAQVHLIQGILYDNQNNPTGAATEYQAAIDASDTSRWIIDEAANYLLKK